jgi:hypothetical protein
MVLKESWWLERHEAIARLLRERSGLPLPSRAGRCGAWDLSLPGYTLAYFPPLDFRAPSGGDGGQFYLHGSDGVRALGDCPLVALAEALAIVPHKPISRSLSVFLGAR